MKLIILFLVYISCVFAQGWVDIPGTHMQDVCPPDNFQPPGGGMPSYSFHSLCYGKLSDYSSAAVDTKRNRLVIWGGGHGGYAGNEIYSLDLTAKTASTGTSCTGAGGTCSTNASAPTMTRVNDPSIFITSPSCLNAADGNPRPQHTWGAWVYMPKHDAFFQWQGYDLCGVADKHVYLLDASTMTWTDKGAPTTASTSSSGTQCVLDPTTAKETVLCLMDNARSLLRYDPDANTMTTVMACCTNQLPNGAGLVVDPDRKLLFFWGDKSSPKLKVIDLVNGYTMSDWTANTVGCGDLMGFDYPSVVWDPSLHRIVGYVPRTAASATANNLVYIFDPATKSCITQPVTGGPPADAHMINAYGDGTEQGMFGRFNYVPALGKYVLVNNFAQDAYYFVLNATATHGLGSSTLTCVDRDGDGYGTGPGCLGPDADDQDAMVHTGPQFLSKWTDIPTGLRHLGYNPTNIWYVSTTGNDGTTLPNRPDLPAATCCGSGKANPAPGDAVLLHGGTYRFWGSATSGTAGHPTIYMSYPGELATFTPYPAGFDVTDASFYVIDGIKFVASGGTACINFATVRNAIVRHADTSGCEWGMDSELPQDLTIEDSISYNNSQHGFYLTNHPPPGSGAISYGKVFVRRNILYNNDWTGFQMNGPFSGSVIEQNIAYNNGDASGGMGFSWLTGVRDTVFRSNVSINNGTGLSIILYQGYCTVYPHNPCPWPETGNLIENFTHYATGKDRNGVAFGGGFGAVVVGSAGDPPTTPTSIGSNIFRNLNLVNYHGAGGYAPLTDTDGTNFATSTFDHLNLYDAYTPAGTGAFTLGYNSGAVFYTCAQAAAVPTLFGSMSNCNLGDPQFVAASTSYYSTPSSFNLQLQSTSPALYAGTATLAPAYDVRGNPFANPPSLGAYEATGVASPPPPTYSPCDINRDGVVNFLDVTAEVSKALGLSACGTVCNVVDVQRVIIATMGGSCLIGQ